jgi:dihydroorotase
MKKLTSGKNSFSIENHLSQRAKANMSLFTRRKKHFHKAAILSKSKTQHFWERKQREKVYGIVNQGKLILA